MTCPSADAFNVSGPPAWAYATLDCAGTYRQTSETNTLLIAPNMGLTHSQDVTRQLVQARAAKIYPHNLLRRKRYVETHLRLHRKDCSIEI